MQKQIVFGEWLGIEEINGTSFLPIEDAPKSVIEFCESAAYPNEIANHPDVRSELLEFVNCNHDFQIFSVERITGFGCGLSAPGHMDCTEWGVFETEKEAEQYLSEMYDE